MAFISSAKNNSGNKEVNTTSIPTASTQVSPAGPNIKHEDINQIDEDDIEEMDIKWNMALLSMRANRFWKKTGKKISIQGTDVAGFDKSKVECFNCHKLGHFPRECKALRSQDKGRRDNYRQGSKVEEQAPKALMAIYRVGWDWSFMENEEENHALVTDEEAPTEFALMAKSSSDDEEIKFFEKIRAIDFELNNKNIKIERLTNELENAKKEKDHLDSKLTGFQSASKDLDNVLESQISDKNKEGLGYSVVPPPPAQVYSPPKKDMSWTGLSEFADDTITDYNRPSPAIESNSDDFQNRIPSIAETEASSSTILSKPAIKFVKSVDRPIETKTDKVETAKKPAVKYAKLKLPTGNTKFSTADLGNKGKAGNSQINIDDKGYSDNGCSRHMTGNISYFSDYEPFDGGYVSFSQGGCKITGKGTIKTDKPEFENVYFMKDLKTPRQHNMYSIDLNNVVPHKDLTCLVAKASADKFGDSYEAPQQESTTASTSEGSVKKKGRAVVFTTDDMQKRKNDVKARTTLLLALPDEHQLRFSKFWKKTGKKISIQGTDVAGFDKSKDWSFMENKEENHALVADEEAPTEFALMDKSSSDDEVFDNSLYSKACKKNTDSLNSKIIELSEKLSDTKTNLYHYKFGLAQVEARLVEYKSKEIKFFEKIRAIDFELNNKNIKIERLTNELENAKKEKDHLDSKLTGFQSASKDLDNVLESHRSDKNKEGLGYSAVPPPPAQVYSPPKKDMSWTGLSEFADDTITNYNRPSPAIESNSDDFQNKIPSVAKTGASSSTILSKPAIKFVKSVDRPIETKTDKVETAKKPAVKYAKLYKKTSKSSNIRGNQRNWNNMKSQQLGKKNLMKNKACFNCGCFYHLSYDCGKWVDQGKSWEKNNYTHKSRSPRTIFHKSGRPPMRTNRPNMNAARPKRTSFYKPVHSYVKKPFQRRSAVRT
nr:hypothetical protein [Tanacetum cinerariifolium]